MSDAVFAYYQGIEVMILPENSYRNEKGTIIAAIIKTDDNVADGIKVPLETPLDNLSFPNGSKCKAMKIINSQLPKKEKKEKEKTIKRMVKI